MNFKRWLIIEEGASELLQLYSEISQDYHVDLMSKAKQGDEEALGELYGFWWDKASSYAANRLNAPKDDPTVQDIASGVMLKFVNQLQAGDIKRNDPGAISNWMNQTVLRQILDYNRKRKKERLFGTGGEEAAERPSVFDLPSVGATMGRSMRPVISRGQIGVTPLDIAMGRESESDKRKKINDAIMLLKPRQQEVMQLYLQGKSEREIQNALGLPSPNMVKSAKTQAVRELKSILGAA